jgi:hypothetical protein
VRLRLLNLLLIACADPTASESSQPWAPPEEDVAAPLTDAPSVEGAFDVLLSSVREWSGAPVITAYEAVMAQADGSCPEVDAFNGNYAWYDDCTTAEGARFEGDSFAHHFASLIEAGSVVEGWTFTCISDVTLPDGTGFGCHGILDHRRAEEPDGTVAFTSISEGAFYGDVAEVEDTWLALEADASLTLGALRLPDGTRSLEIDGAVAGFGVEGLLGASFAALSLDDPECPAGTIAVRDTAGEWYSATFDCDPCADLTFRGASLGEVCVDFAPLLDWGDAPW